jgi:hypothetical protein
LNKLLGLALLGVGGYFLWQQFMAPQAAATPSTPGAGASPPAPTPSIPTAAMTTLANALQAAAVASANSGASPMPPLNVSQWNWLMNNKTNPGSQAAQLPSVTGNIDALTYVQDRAAAGFGLSGVMRRTNHRNYRRRF